MSRRRNLSDEEQALWAGIARSVKPLRPARATPKPVIASADDVPPRRQPPPHRSDPAAKALPLALFDQRQRQRVARGRNTIDARIDLHGMTQSEAHAALLRFLHRAQMSEAKVVLVVTGKGASQGVRDPRERGVLRRQVPMWLALPEFRRLVVGFVEAHAIHGGQGALYVRLRRAN